MSRTAVDGGIRSVSLLDWVLLLRPAQWVKNLLVFAALIFSMHLFVAESVVKAIVAFASFCLLASAAYVVNDLHDADKDRLHQLRFPHLQRPVEAVGTH